MSDQNARKKQTSFEDRHPFIADVALAYGLPAVIIPIVLFAVSVFGIWDSMHDARGDRLWGSLPLICSGLMGVWWAGSFAFYRNLDALKLIIRIITSTLMVGFPLIIANWLATIVLYAIPSNREVIQVALKSGSGFHYYWNEGAAFQIWVLPLISIISAGVSGLFTLLIVTLPVMAIRDPMTLQQGSHIQGYQHTNFRDNITAFVFLGLSSLTLGLILKMGLGGSVRASEIGPWFRNVGRYGLWNMLGSSYEREVLWWLLGVFFLVVGGAIIAYGLLRVIIVRLKGVNR